MMILKLCLFIGRLMGVRVVVEVVLNSSLIINFVFGVVCLLYFLYFLRKISEIRVFLFFYFGLFVLFISGRKDLYCRFDLMDIVLNRMVNDWKMYWVEGVDYELKLCGRVNYELILDMCEWFV